jgi:predicted flap endonuclease-1-like 5' DNA nuclease
MVVGSARSEEAHAMKIEDLEGVGPVLGAKLRDAGVQTTDDLLEKAGSAAGRGALAAATGIGESQLLKWTNHVDLYRLSGVGSEYADLLEASGVDSCAELARRNPANLATTMAEANAARGFVRRLPTEATITAWIEQAKTLPKVVTH